MIQDSDRKTKPLLIVLLGPTGVGKTKISLRLASAFNCPILSSDSRQIFRELSIGTAAPGKDELNSTKHYFIHTHSLFDDYSAGQYEQDAIRLLEDEVFSNSRAALLVGGSMMYIDAVCKGMDEIPQVSADIRNHWLDVYEKEGLNFVQEKLREMDPLHYSQVDLQNYKRVLHALEICSSTGGTYSELRTGIRKERSFRILKIGLDRPREELYERIDQRVDQMLNEGLVEEARPFLPYRNLNSLNTVGYKELYDWMDGKYDFDEAVRLIKRDTRRYAKRQMTWFRRDKDIHWFHPDDEEAIVQVVTEFLNDL